MGLLDDAGSLFASGVASAGRTTSSIKLKAQISDLGKRREKLESQLGASLYEETRNNSAYRASREDLYASIESLDAQREALRVELSNIELQAQLVTKAIPVANVAQAGLRCTGCNAPIYENDVFCSGCGKSVADIREALKLCTGCGSPLGESNSFCTNCGLALTSTK